MHRLSNGAGLGGACITGGGGGGGRVGERRSIGADLQHVFVSRLILQRDRGHARGCKARKPNATCASATPSRLPGNPISTMSHRNIIVKLTSLQTTASAQSHFVRLQRSPARSILSSRLQRSKRGWQNLACAMAMLSAEAGLLLPFRQRGGGQRRFGPQICKLQTLSSTHCVLSCLVFVPMF